MLSGKEQALQLLAASSLFSTKKSSASCSLSPAAVIEAKLQDHANHHVQLIWINWLTSWLSFPA